MTNEEIFFNFQSLIFNNIQSLSENFENIVFNILFTQILIKVSLKSEYLMNEKIKRASIPYALLFELYLLFFYLPKALNSVYRC